MTMDRVSFEKSGKVATITLNRPEKLNAIDNMMLRGIEAALKEARRDSEVRVVVFKGAGRAFSVGQDLGSDENNTDEIVPPPPRAKAYTSDVLESMRILSDRLESIRYFPRYKIARVHGYCLGMACQIAMSCDVVVAARDAILGDPSVRMGVAPMNPLWTWRVGVKKAKELLLTGKYVSGEEASRIGLVMKSVDQEKLDEEVSLAAQALTKLGGIGGYDGQAGYHMADEVKYELAGLSAARKYCAMLHGLSALQRPGRSIVDREEFNFHDVRDEHGLKEALRKRDERFAEFFKVR